MKDNVYVLTLALDSYWVNETITKVIGVCKSKEAAIDFINGFINNTHTMKEEIGYETVTGIEGLENGIQCYINLGGYDLPYYFAITWKTFPLIGK